MGRRATLIERELEVDPENHWLLTQLGVTYYERRRYDEALKRFAASFAIVPDCPLTLWNMAGTLDALGKSESAVSFYTWLLESEKSAADDPCWESREWAETLKADCVYRLGGCYRHLGDDKRAAHYYRQYVNFLLVGVEGTYSMDDALRHLRGANGAAHATERELRALIRATLKGPGIQRTNGRRS